MMPDHGMRTGARQRATSLAAVGSVPVLRHRLLTLWTLRALGPSTHERLVAALAGRCSAESVRGRCSELVRLGAVREAGRAVNRRGLTVIVWEATKIPLTRSS